MALGFAHLVCGEVAHPDMGHHFPVEELFHRGHGPLYGIDGIWPVYLVEVYAVRAQFFQTRLAGAEHAVVGEVPSRNLGRYEDLF